MVDDNVPEGDVVDVDGGGDGVEDGTETETGKKKNENDRTLFIGEGTFYLDGEEMDQSLLRRLNPGFIFMPVYAWLYLSKFTLSMPCENLQTSGSFVCAFSFSSLSVLSTCSVLLEEVEVEVEVKEVEVGVAKKTLGNYSLLSSDHPLLCVSLYSLMDSCLFSFQSYLNLKLKLNISKCFFIILGLHTRTYTNLYSHTLYESLGLHIRTHIRIILINIKTLPKIILLNNRLTYEYLVSEFRPKSKKYGELLYPSCIFGTCAVSFLSGLLKRQMLLLCGDVERNPGPFLNDKKLIILTQNCRGLNNSTKLKHLMSNKKRIVRNDHFVLALQETYLIDDSAISWCGKNAFTKAESLHSAGCITFFSDTVRILEKRDIDDRGHGHVVVVEGLGDKLTIIVNVYAPVRGLTSQQVSFYETLEKMIEEIESKYVMYEPNLVVLGDLNIPLEIDMINNPAEKNRAKQLSTYFSALGLVDCWKPNDDRITLRGGQSRLDRILYRINGEVKETLHLDWTFTKSDHCMVGLTLEDVKVKRKSRRIVSLPTYILGIPAEKQKIIEGMVEFKEMMEEGWSVHTKLEFLKTGLRTVVGEVVKLRNKKDREELESIQLALERRMTYTRTISLRAMEENLQEIESLFARRNNILEARCEALAVKAKTKWFYEGEKSSKYFLNMLRKRGAVTEIKELEINGQITTNEDDIKAEISSFYRNLYEQGGEPNVDENFFSLVNKIPPEAANALTAPLLKEEILHTLKTCKDSAPGPDGISYSYYLHLWDIFGDVIAQSWQEGLRSNILPASHRSSILKLLPKEGKDLNKLNNWRPITLSNCDHKVITKCYAKRMTDLLQIYLHPNQTAYLPGKQIHDNLRLLDITNKSADDPIMIALDAKKAFDSVTHGYIKRVLGEYGLANFIQIFDLLYTDQKVDIAINGDIIAGYNIKNGVKQGDSLSCILFILGIDPLIRNIENNPEIGRVDIPDCVAPKILAYADDITCITDTARGVKNIFLEYERLSKASGLMLNADKTEILDRNSALYSFRYMNCRHRVVGKQEAKINGIIFNCNSDRMRQQNFEMLKEKISAALLLWKMRRLSLLGKILIYKTYGLSQIIYVLTVVELDPDQYKHIQLMFNNFLWGRDLNGESNRNRISWKRLCNPIEKGGFGMIHFKEIVDSIRCRQFGKMFNEKYTHPLKYAILTDDGSYASWQCLKRGADLVAKTALEKLKINLCKILKTSSNEEIVTDNLLIQRVGEIETLHTIKVNKRADNEATALVHYWGCEKLKDIFIHTRQHRAILAICRRIMIAKFFRIVKLLHQRNLAPLTDKAEKIRLAGKTYKYIADVTSKEFRLLLQPSNDHNANKLREQFDEPTCRGYFAQIKKLISTRHKNTLLRVWNGDCLSYTRLFRFGITDSNRCPRCGELDSPEHMLLNCGFARRTWELLQRKIPKSLNCTWLQYAIGINDSCLIMMVKAEVLKYLMHYRELEPESIVNKTIAYFKAVLRQNLVIQAL